MADQYQGRIRTVKVNHADGTTSETKLQTVGIAKTGRPPADPPSPAPEPVPDPTPEPEPTPAESPEPEPVLVDG